tara:strand:- start:1156 stop:2658 length:1503 start_codon:yes stop_codon:yes gene_type:complete
MAIDITSLFQDILESPEQKQQRQMMEGFKRRDNAVAGLTGMAQAAAPLVGTMAELQPQRNEMLQRGVGRLLGRDVRSTSEKVSDALKGFNPQDPQSVSQTTQMLQQLGLGAQGAQLASMALEEQNNAKIQGEEAALRKQQSASNDLSIARSTQVNADATQANTDRTAFRTQAAAMIAASEGVTDSEKSSLGIQANAGVFDGPAGAETLRAILSPVPVKVGDRALVKKNGQWEYVADSGSQGIRTSLLNAAFFQHGGSPTEMALLTDAINSGAITKAEQFEDYVPKPDTVSEPPSKSVEDYHVDSLDKQFTAAAGVRRIDNLITTIFDNGLMNEPAGIFSDILEGAKDTFGVRDTTSFVRTAFTAEVNQELIKSMPSGPQSDTDVALFSKGFPPKNAPMHEVVAWLEAARRTMYRVQDFQSIKQEYLAAQLREGKMSTSIGLGSAATKAMADVEQLNSRESFISRKLEAGEYTQEEAQQLWSADIAQYQQLYGFIPSQYNR